MLLSPPALYESLLTDARPSTSLRSPPAQMCLCGPACASAYCVAGVSSSRCADPAGNSASPGGVSFSVRTRSISSSTARNAKAPEGDRAARDLDQPRDRRRHAVALLRQRRCWRRRRHIQVPLLASRVESRRCRCCLGPPVGTGLIAGGFWG